VIGKFQICLARIRPSNRTLSFANHSSWTSTRGRWSGTARRHSGVIPGDRHAAAEIRLPRLSGSSRASAGAGKFVATNFGRRPLALIEEVRFAVDSSLEGDGFELSVPGRAIRPFGRGEGVFQ
jgi:hypothetical protein